MCFTFSSGGWFKALGLPRELHALCEELCGGSLAVPESAEGAGASRVGILGVFAAVLSQGILNKAVGIGFLLILCRTSMIEQHLCCLCCD